MGTIELDDVKRSHRAIWSTGDYAAVAEAITEHEAPRHLLERVPVGPADEVLDVATGTGVVALRAAAAGARVTGLDLAPALLEIAARRAAQEGLAVDWVEGDAERLPLEDGRFDRVLSAFGVQFAPHHEAAAAELARVCRPGGAIGLVAWTPEGQVGELFRIMGRVMPPPPPGASPPPLWGDEGHVRELLGPYCAGISVERGAVPLRFDSAEHYAAFMETCYGPVLTARERLTPDGRWQATRAEVVAMMERRNESTDGTLRVPAEYLLVVARRAGA
jgi:SAM-dependent methyltransferase